MSSRRVMKATQHLTDADAELIEKAREADVMSVGRHCHNCRQLDLLPVRCFDCNHYFCADCADGHARECAAVKALSRTVPVCPVCNQAVLPPPRPAGNPTVAEMAAAAEARVAEHLDSGCKLHVVARGTGTGGGKAKGKPGKAGKSKPPRCAAKGCKTRLKPWLSFGCGDCGANYCAAHRNPSDHACVPVAAAGSSRLGSCSAAAAAAMARRANGAATTLADMFRSDRAELEAR